ncbi:MAG: DinB family protein [Cyclobacteriaceae bacterium]|nr:DinB family protein [Cyclobacteriaceae bacterium]
MTALDVSLLQWDTYHKRMQKMFDTLNEDKYMQPVMPGGNSPSWLLGHLVVTDDALLELLGIGKRLFPELDKIYHHERGANQDHHLSKQELKEKYLQISAALSDGIKKMTEAQWLDRHMAVSPEDFAKEPHRNKLNVLLSRVSHKAHHIGQILMQPK